MINWCLAVTRPPSCSTCPSWIVSIDFDLNFDPLIATCVPDAKHAPDEINVSLAAVTSVAARVMIIIFSVAIAVAINPEMGIKIKNRIICKIIKIAIIITATTTMNLILSIIPIIKEIRANTIDVIAASTR